MQQYAKPAMTVEVIELDPVELRQLEEERARAEADRQARVDTLGKSLYGELETRKTLRTELEREWLRAEYAYNDQYHPDELKRIVGTQVYASLTRSKVDTFVAHTCDMLMPNADEKFWGIEASPKPILAQTANDQAPIGQTPEGAQVQMGDLSKGIADVAKERAKNMELLCEDQMAQCYLNAEYRKGIAWMYRYGTFIMRGPMKAPAQRRSWKQIQGAVYKLTYEDSKDPCFEAVNPFHFYPDPAIRKITHRSGTFELFFFTESQLRRMAKAGFDAEAIKSVLGKTGGRRMPPQWYTDLSLVTRDRNMQESATKGLYEGWLYIGDITGDQLRDLMPNEDIDPELDSVNVTLWGIGDTVIKAERTVLDTDDVLYSVYPLIESESSLFGHGIPWAGKDAQESYCSYWRMLIDNGAASAIPSVALLKSRLRPADGSYDYAPGKFWYVTTPEDDSPGEVDVRKVIQYIDFPVKIQELMVGLQTAKTMFDESVNFSLVMQGETGPYTPDTATATNTHYNAGRVVLNRTIKGIDDHITIPNFRRLIDWNMMISEDETVKGDLNPIAKGSSVLMARAEQMQLMNAAMPLLLNPQYAYMFDQDHVLEEYTKAMRLSQILRSEDERKKMKGQAAQQQQPPTDPAKMAMVEVAKGRLQLDAKIHDDEMQMEAQRIVADAQSSGLTAEEIRQRLGLEHKKVGLAAQKIDSENARFNAEAAMKMRQGSGI